MATLTMPSIFDNSPIFGRSHSSSNLPDLVTEVYEKPESRLKDELPRSASFPSLPSLDSHYKTSEKELQRGHSSDALPLSPTENKVMSGILDEEVKATKRLTKEERPKIERAGRRRSMVARPKSWIQKVKGVSPERNPYLENGNPPVTEIPPVPAIPKQTREKTKTVSESFATFARKSWMSTSRSPSPNRVVAKETEVPNEEVQKSSGLRSSPSSTSLAVPTLEKPSTNTNDSPTKRFLKKRPRPQSVLMTSTSINSANSSTSSIPRSSMDNRSTPRTSTDKVPPMPNALEKIQSIALEPRKKDELWSAFRSLENDFSKFQSKTSALKTNVVRSTILPFLRNHANHPSINVLRPEDLDRRANIFNKWWNGLLEMLDGRPNQTVSGTDRPILLEAITGIMMRPEWRMPPSPFAPLSESPEILEQPRRKSSTSSQFLMESVYHNIRNMFIQNLLTQMNLVVDKMSLRHAPASLVTFCGKACAYAFMFVPGVADILVRIWKLPVETIRRVADELGLPRRINKVEMDEIIANFPIHTHTLGWSSAKSLANNLRQKAVLPPLAAKIPWYGPWIARWCGRESDLFFIFTKHYHILAEEFLSSELTLTEKARAPGFVLVHAQILTALDSTIHRQPAAAESLPLTFDDVLAGADASAAALPLPSSNVTRLMAENRLIMLLRDFISERPSIYESARLTFAAAFSKMMQATARKTSLFDHNACFVLCDFMEEASALFVRFHHSNDSESDFIDWYFWLDVCKKILDSQNTMSEIRLFAFVFGVWGVVTSNDRRKEVLCIDWLLSDKTFDKFFNHWCPMVRAYYMRLLCWRLCRDDGDSTELDTKIFNLASTRLKINWSHYLFLKQTSEKSLKLAPSTTPCLPAPGRRLLIIRNDTQAPSPIFLGFDGNLSSPSTSSPTPTLNKRNSILGSTSLAKLESSLVSSSDGKSVADSPSSTSTTPKKRWTLINKMLPSSFTSDTSSAGSSTSDNETRSSSPPSPTASKSKTLEEARRETALARSSQRPPLQSKNSSTDSESTPATHRAFSFKFSLEWTNHLNSTSQIQAALAQANRGDPPRERRIIPPRLPAPAQAWLGSRVPGTSREVAARDPAEYYEPEVYRRSNNDNPHAAESRANALSRPYIGSAKGKAERARYAGRALAEWALIVAECNNFVERRRAEGVPNLRLVEIPTLGVEGFRKFG
ncbi:UPF0592 membrane protein C7D4.03c [Phlyctema vagabunda]|uniref:UPF0592 membrane protein C7D4.03c n=1 Tax=Phlyctema vagabunda TaxID=108571 RepID=A0ABR4PWV8_9HELO